MKKIFGLLFLCVITLTNVSCSDDEDPDQNEYQPGAFVATIEGETVDFFYKPRAVIGRCNDIPCMMLYGINGVQGNKELSINIDNLNGTGTYVIGGTSNNFGYYSTWPPEGGLVTNYVSFSEEGSFTVTSYEGNNIKGNFSFPASKIGDKSIISISGSFDLIVSE